MTRRRLWTVSLTLLLLGCADSRDGGAPGASLEEWTLGEPTVQLGSVADGPDAFSNVRAVALGPEGNLFVLLPQEACVKVFSPTGEFLRSIGREGEGPGEFSRPTSLGFLADTLWVQDDRARRISFFENGEYTGSASFPDVTDLHPERIARVGGVMTGRRVLVSTDGRTPFQPEETSTPSPLLLATEEGFDTLALFSSDHVGGFLTRMSGGQLAMVAPFVQPFQDQGFWRLGPDGSSVALIHRDADGADPAPEATVILLGVSGDTIFSTPLPYDPTPLPESIVDSLVTRFAGERFDRDVAEDALYVPDHYPTVSDALIGSDGSVWLAREATDGPSRRWTILSRDGRPTAELDVQHLSRHPLARAREEEGT